MKWTSQAVAIFGLLAVFAFQVQRSSAAPFGGLELDNNNENTTNEQARIESAKQELSGIEEVLREEIAWADSIVVDSKLNKIVAKQSRARLFILRDEAQKIVAEFEGKEVSVKAKEIVTLAEENIKKINEKINPNNDVAEDEEDIEIFGLADKAKAILEKLKQTVKKEIEKIKKIVSGPGAKEAAKKIKARLVKIRDIVRYIGEVSGDTKVGALAKELVKVIDEAIKQLDKFIGPQGTNDVASEDDDFELSEDDLEAVAFGLVDKAKAILEKLKQVVHKEIEKIKKIVSGPGAKEAAKKIKARLVKIREIVRYISEVSKDTKVGALAKELLKVIDEAIKQLDKFIGSQGTNDVTEDEETDVVDREEITKQITQRLEKLTNAIRKNLEIVVDLILLNKNDVSDNAELTARVVFQRLREIQVAARRYVETLGENEVADKAKEVLKQADEALTEVAEVLKQLKAKKEEANKPKPTTVKTF